MNQECSVSPISPWVPASYIWSCVSWYEYTTFIVSKVQYSTIQYNTVQYSSVHNSTVQYSTIQYIAVQYITVQYSTVQYSRVKYSTVQYITVLYSTLQYTTVYRRPYSKFMIDTIVDNSGQKFINKLRKNLGSKIFNELCSKRHSDWES